MLTFMLEIIERIVFFLILMLEIIDRIVFFLTFMPAVIESIVFLNTYARNLWKCHIQTHAETNDPIQIRNREWADQMQYIYV